MFAFAIVEHVGADGAVGERVGGFFTGSWVVGIETEVLGLVGVVYPMVDFREVEVVAAGIARTELALAGVDPDPLIEGCIEDFDDGVATGEEDFEVVSGLVRFGLIKRVAHTNEAGGDIQTVESVAEDLAEVGAPTMINPCEDAFMLPKGV